MVPLLLTQAYGEGLLKKQDIFISLLAEDSNNRSNIPHWKHARFDLKLLDNEKHLSVIRLTKLSVISLCHVYGIHDTIKTINRNLASSGKTLSIWHKQLQCLCRYCDMGPSSGYLFTLWDQVWVFSGNLVNFSTAVHNKRRVIDNCWDFIDGAARSCCRPEGHEMVFCNGALMAQGCHQVFMFPLYGFSAILSGTFHLVTSRKTLRFL